MPAISVILAIYKVKPYLRQCIESVMNQTFKDLEIICVVDGDDECEEICREYAKADARIRVLPNDRQSGLVRTRKNGLAAATGSFIAFLDGDDWVDPQLYGHMYDKITKYNASFVTTASTYEPMNGKSYIRTDSIPEGFYGGDDYIQKVIPRLIYRADETVRQYGIMPSIWNKLYRPQLMRECYGRLDDKCHMFEDSAALYTYAAETDSLYVSHEAFHHYRMRDNSLTKKPVGDLVYMIKTHFKVMKSVFEKQEYSKCLLEQLDCFYLHSCLVYIPEVLDYGQSGEKILRAYGGILRSERIVLYGAGTMGCALHHYLAESEGVNVVMWVDSAYEHFNKEMNIKPPSDIFTAEYDKIVVGVDDRMLEIRQWLIDRGVDEKKICYVDDDKFYRKRDFCVKVLYEGE